MEKAGDTADTSPPATESTGEPTSAGTENVEPTATMDETGATEPGATDPGVTDPGATEPGATDPGDTETDGDTEGDTGMVIPAECVMRDPDVTAAFSLAIGEWPEMADDGHELDVMCTIDAMTVEPEAITHALICDDAGTPRPVTLTVALAIGGPVMWSEGDSVRLKSYRVKEVDFGIDDHSIGMWAADETPLLLAHHGGGDLPPAFDPLAYAAEFPCGPEDTVNGDWGMPFAVRFELGEAAVSIVHGHRDVLPIDGTAVFAIDLAEATTNYCCHYTRDIRVLIQRIMPL